VYSITVHVFSVVPLQRLPHVRHKSTGGRCGDRGRSVKQLHYLSLTCPFFTICLGSCSSSNVLHRTYNQLKGHDFKPGLNKTLQATMFMTTAVGAKFHYVRRRSSRFSETILYRV
jgi:hypothetical protein